MGTGSSSSVMRIFIASPDDVEKTISLAEYFIEDAHLPGGFDRDHYIHQWRNLISNNLGIMILAEYQDKIIGGISAIMFPGTNSGVMQCVETAWFTEPTLKELTRKLVAVRLFDRLQEEASNRGCKYISMGLVDGYRDKGLPRLYSSRGFKKFEETWIKEVI